VEVPYCPAPEHRRRAISERRRRLRQACREAADGLLDALRWRQPQLRPPDVVLGDVSPGVGGGEQRRLRDLGVRDELQGSMASLMLSLDDSEQSC